MPASRPNNIWKRAGEIIHLNIPSSCERDPRPRSQVSIIRVAPPPTTTTQASLGLRARLTKSNKPI